MELASHGSTRRTQAQRRTQTRRVLLEATISSLVELGYSGTTTLEVERRAGMSRGARIHHFESKAALFAAAVDYLYEQLSDQYDEAFSAAKRRQTDRQRLRGGLHMLWGIYQRPQYSAVLELSLAARQDSELKECLRAVAERHRELALHAGKTFFPSLGRARLEGCIETIHAAFMGLRVQGALAGAPKHTEQVLRALEDLVAGQLELEKSEE